MMSVRTMLRSLAGAALALAVTASGAGAQNCSILTGGNPCNPGCPDECSFILCPGNALCLSKCGGSGCNIGCSPGPCGAGCPDECSPILCPGNALCRSDCGGSTCNIGCSPGPCGAGCPDECSFILCPGNALCRSDCGGNSCNVTCSPGPCGAGCPDECSFILCPGNACSCSDAGEFCLVSANCCAGDQVCAFPQQVCAHDPRQLGEPCGPLAPCRDGLRCGIELLCKEPSKVGEGCLIGSDCEDGLDCRACFVEGCPAPFTCFPRGEQRLFGEAECLAYYSPALQRTAAGSGLTHTFGYGSAAAIGAGGSFEMGTVYGQDGRYGCFLTTCVGGTIDIEIGSFVSIGFYTAFDALSGSSVAIVEEAGEGLNFITSQILASTGELIGTEDCLSIEASVAPITAGVFDCDTIVNAFSIAPPPTTTSTSLPPGFTTTSVVTTTSTSVTSTTFPVVTVPELLTLLGNALPAPDVEDRRARRFARKLHALFDKADARLLEAATASGKRCTRLYNKARKGLQKLQVVARRADEKERLGVPLGSIEILAQALLMRVPTSCDG